MGCLGPRFESRNEHYLFEIEAVVSFCSWKKQLVAVVHWYHRNYIGVLVCWYVPVSKQVLLYPVVFKSLVSAMNCPYCRRRRRNVRVKFSDVVVIVLSLRSPRLHKHLQRRSYLNMSWNRVWQTSPSFAITDAPAFPTRTLAAVAIQHDIITRNAHTHASSLVF